MELTESIFNRLQTAYRAQTITSEEIMGLASSVTNGTLREILKISENMMEALESNWDTIKSRNDPNLHTNLFKLAESNNLIQERKRTITHAVQPQTQSARITPIIPEPKKINTERRKAFDPRLYSILEEGR